MVLDRGIWERVWEATGAGSGWLCQEQVRREMGSGRCTGGWVRGLGAARGGTLGYAVGIVNGAAGGGTLGVEVGGTIGGATGGTFVVAVGLTLGDGDGVGALVGNTLRAVAGVGTSVGGISEWWGRKYSVGTKVGSWCGFAAVDFQ